MTTSLILAAALAVKTAAAAPAASPYAGNWNLRITDASDTS